MSFEFNLGIVPRLTTFWARHQGSGTDPDGDIQISDEEFDRQSKANVERWVSAHIVPVSHCFGAGLGVESLYLINVTVLRRNRR